MLTLKEWQRREEETSAREDAEEDQLDLDKIGQFCAGVARVVVPMIRVLHKGPGMLEAAARAAA
jgi:hypothetical protein